MMGMKVIIIPVKHDSLSDKANYMGGDLDGIIEKLKTGYFESLRNKCNLDFSSL